MKTWLALVRISLKNQLSLSVLKQRYLVKKEKLWEPALMLFVLLAFIPLVTFIVGLYVQIYIGLALIDQQAVTITVAVILGLLLTLVFGFLYAVGNLYFAKDIEGLLPLPVTPTQVLSARLVPIWINEVLTLLPFTLPGLLVYGVLEGSGIAYYAGVVILMGVLPVLPLTISTLIAMLLMRVTNTNFKKYRDHLRTFGGLALGVVIFVVFQLFGQNRMADLVNDPAALQALLSGPNSLVDLTGRIFPPLMWATYSLVTPFATGGWIWWGLFISISGLTVLIVIWLGNYIFYPGLIGGSETQSRKKTWKPAEMTARIEQTRSPLLALYIREWKVFFRTPVFVMNGLSPMIIFPVFMLVPLLTQSGLADLIQSINQSPIGWDIVTWVGVALSVFVGSLNGIAATAISREGRLFSFTKTIPVPAEVQLRAKWLNTLTISALAVAVIGVFSWIIGAPFTTGIWILLLGTLACSLFNAVGLLIDLRFPKLNWTNPQEAISKNVNILFLMLLQFVLLGILAGLLALTLIIGIPPLAIHIIFLVIFALTSWGLLKAVEAYAKHRYDKIEL